MKEKERFQRPPGAPQPEVPFVPFLLLTASLIIVPTPIAISLSAYRALYSSIHANPTFCEMGFGPHFPARQPAWSDEETRRWIQECDIAKSWMERGMGDFAVGIIPTGGREEAPMNEAGRLLGDGSQGIRIVEKEDYLKLVGNDHQFLHDVQWVGYAGVRDATTTSMPNQKPEDPELPPWQEMIELRYGVTPEYWGEGYARAAAEAIMQWAASERDVKRFIAETERENMRSGRVLAKLGFHLNGTNYWKEPSEIEWERVSKGMI